MSSVKGVKYWEMEKPVIQGNQHNEVRFFEKFGQVQVFPKVPGTTHGVGKGATLDLAGMTPAELDKFEEEILKMIALQRKEKSSKAV